MEDLKPKPDTVSVNVAFWTCVIVCLVSIGITLGFVWLHNFVIQDDYVKPIEIQVAIEPIITVKNNLLIVEYNKTIIEGEDYATNKFRNTYLAVGDSIIFKGITQAIAHDCTWTEWRQWKEPEVEVSKGKFWVRLWGNGTLDTLQVK